MVCASEVQPLSIPAATSTLLSHVKTTKCSHHSLHCSWFTFYKCILKCSHMGIEFSSEIACLGARMAGVWKGSYCARVGPLVNSTHVTVQHLPLWYHLHHGSIFHHDSTFHPGSTFHRESILVLENIRSPRAQRCKYKTSQTEAVLTMAIVREHLGRIFSSAFHRGSSSQHDRAASLSSVGRGRQ